VLDNIRVPVRIARCKKKPHRSRGLVGLRPALVREILGDWVQTSGMALVQSIGVAMVLVGLMAILTLRRFVRFVAAGWRATLPKAQATLEGQSS